MWRCSICRRRCSICRLIHWRRCCQARRIARNRLMRRVAWSIPLLVSHIIRSECCADPHISNLPSSMLQLDPILPVCHCSNSLYRNCSLAHNIIPRVHVIIIHYYIQHVLIRFLKHKLILPTRSLAGHVGDPSLLSLASTCNDTVRVHFGKKISASCQLRTNRPDYQCSRLV